MSIYLAKMSYKQYLYLSDLFRDSVLLFVLTALWNSLSLYDLAQSLSKEK